MEEEVRIESRRVIKPTFRLPLRPVLAVFGDGPFVESKEYLAGVWVWEAPDLDVALKLAAEASKVCDRKIEVRPFQ